MDQEQFYLSVKGEVRRYERTPEGLPLEYFERFSDFEDPVISTMTLTEDHLFTGTYYGTCSYIHKGTRLIANQKIHSSNRRILAMTYDPHSHLLCSANFRQVKLSLVEGSAITTVGKVKLPGGCLKVDKSSGQLVVGNVCTWDFQTGPVLSLVDIETLQRRDLRCASSGIVDMVWHRSHHRS